MKTNTHKWGFLVCLAGLAPMLSGCPNDADDGDDATMPTCGDLSSAFELDRLTNGVSDWEEEASPMCTFGVRNSSGGGVQVFAGGAADYEEMLAGAKAEFDMEVIETNAVGARSFEYNGLVGGWLETAEIGFLDFTERYAVLVFITDSMDEDVLDMVEAIAVEVDANLSDF